MYSRGRLFCAHHSKGPRGSRFDTAADFGKDKSASREKDECVETDKGGRAAGAVRMLTDWQSRPVVHS